MLLTVSVVNLLSHVAPLFAGQGVSLHLNKLQPVEVIRHWIGESNTSAFQQQQFQHQLKMLLGGGGEGGGIASPIASRGNGGVSKDDQLPRASRQSISDSADEQSSVPHLSNTPSKRIRPSSDDITESNVGTSQRLSKKVRLSDSSGQRPSEEQEEASPQVGKLNISQDSTDRSSIFQESYDEGQVSSKQASQEMQKIPNFDDLLTQAIQAVSPQTSSPVKEIAQTQVQTPPSELAPIAKEKRTTVSALTTTVPAAAVNQTSKVTPVKPAEQSISVPPTTQEKTQAQVQTPPSELALIAKEKRTTVSALTTTVPAAAVNQTSKVTPVKPVEQSIPTPPVIQKKTQVLVSAPSSSAPASLSNESASQFFRSKKAPPLIESATMQVDPVVMPEPMDTETTND